MRAFCTVSAPLEVCASSAEQLSPGSRFLALRLLGNQQPKTLYFLVNAKSRVREVYSQTCLHFATQGMQDTELFGLAVLIDGEYMFADPESKLSKYGPKSWRSSHTHGLDANGRPLLELHFRVQFYIESPHILKDEASRHNYYLQLKYNTLQRDIPKDYNEHSMILLAGLALQADLGDVPAVATANAVATAATTNTSTTTTNNSTTTNNNKKNELNKSQEIKNCNSDDSGDGGESITRTATDDKTISIKCNEFQATSTSTTATGGATTTLPKISKRTNSANDRVLRLSTYVASTSQTNVKPLKTITTTTTTTTTDFPITSSKSNGSQQQQHVGNTPGTADNSTPAAKRNGTAIAADYFRVEDYLPAGLRTAWAVSALRACHRENRGMLRADAELHYIQQACAVQESINAHTYRMRLSKNETGPGNSWFVIYAKGIKIINTNDSIQTHSQAHQQTTFLWPNITKLSFERKKFEIRSDDNKITLYASTDEKNKMLFTLCKETHQFSMKLAARLKEVIKREEEESNSLHACYIYSRSLHLPYKNKSDQRISVISSTSSNTTSGIVSDRVHSEDELEIMINSPPAPIAAPSTESLALAHLLDQPSVSRQTSSVGQVSLKDLEEQFAALSVRQAQKQQIFNNSGTESTIEISGNTSGGNSSSSSSIPISMQRIPNDSSSNLTDSPNSQHNIGSQCSSTCSTVVVSTSAEACAASVRGVSPRNVPIVQRRNSTSSSLELGFSHTAQNSTVSEAESTCVPHDFMPTSLGETESVSGVYTLANGAPPTETSGVYTMVSSEMTGQSSEIAESEKSSHYGIFQPAKSEISDDHLRVELASQDSVDGGNQFAGKRIKNEEFRLRSDSNVSASGSFRGDGSDPRDTKHALLSAEELTDLIVGRGSYPNRKTVANTLDSDCDYVTLPLPLEGESYIQGHEDTAPSEDQVEDIINDLLPTDPPAPPKRIDSNHHSNRASLSNIRMRSPPPYHARHEKTGLCGPPVRPPVNVLPKLSVSTNSTPTAPILPTQLPAVPSTSAKLVEAKIKSKLLAQPPPLPPTAPIRRRDPPPYPLSTKPRPTSLISVSSAASSSTNAAASVHSLSTANGGSMTSLKSEEITARFITTRPQINILKAHTSVVNENPKPSYAAPTYCSSAASSTGSICSHHLTSHLSQHSVHNSNYASGSQNSLSLGQRHHHTTSATSAAVAAHAAAAAAAGAGVIPSTIGIPIVPYSLHSAHKSMSYLHHHQQQPPPPPPPYPDTRACVLLPVIKPRQFLPPPPPSLPRQPPPPPPTQLTGVYTSQLARKQMELYQQQLYSDVDYVIYPIQDPAVSQQEYLDSKQGSLLAAMAQTPPPHPYLAYQTHSGGWDTCKGHAIYRSTPYLPLALSTHSRYASTQNLSDTYVQLPSAYSPLYSRSSLCSSYEPPPPPPLHPAALATAVAVNTSSLFARSRSDDNILNTLDSLPKVKRLPPPPPPPYVNRRLKKPPMPTPTENPPPIPSKPAPNLHTMTTTPTQAQIPQTSTPSNSKSSSTNAVVTRTQLPPRKPPTLTTTSHMTKTSSGAQWIGERPKPFMGISRGSNSILAHLQASIAAANQQAAKTQGSANASATSSTSTTTAGTTTTAPSGSAAAAAAAAAAANALDIALLREKSKNLDLPLISALCNDRSLLKQTKVLVNPKKDRHSTQSTSTTTSHTTNNSTNTNSTMPMSTATTTTNAVTTSPTTGPATNNHGVSKSMAITTIHMNGVTTTATSTTTTANSTKTSGTTTVSNGLMSTGSVGNNVAKTRKTSLHRHPNDKLPPLPMQLAEANNYVMDPAILKHHKSYNSQT